MDQNKPLGYKSIDQSLSVRYATEQDAEFFAVLANDPDVHRYIPWAKSIHNLGQVQELIRHWVHTRQLRYVIEQDCSKVGYIGFWPDYSGHNLQVGYAIMPTYRGQQIIGRVLAALEKEMVSSGRAVGFAAYVDPKNTSSQRVLEKSSYVNTGQKDDKTGELRFEKTGTA